MLLISLQLILFFDFTATALLKGNDKAHHANRVVGLTPRNLLCEICVCVASLQASSHIQMSQLSTDVWILVQACKDMA